MKNSTATIIVESSDYLKSIDPEMQAGRELTLVPVIQIYSPLEEKFNLLAKRFFDVVFSSLAIIFCLTWLTPVLAILIKLDSKGPVFFFQKRAKRGKRFFACIKFRTMIQNEEADVTAAQANDHRITRLGSFLRMHHLDELPQLFNVWLGDMSLIGPRPYMVSDDQKFESMVAQYAMRYRVKPGITGLSQVLGYVGPVAGIKSLEERVKHDAYYILHWSPWLDFKIFCRTFFKMMGQKNISVS